MKLGCEVGLLEDEVLEETEADEADLAVDEERGTSDLGLLTLKTKLNTRQESCEKNYINIS